MSNKEFEQKGAYIKSLDWIFNLTSDEKPLSRGATKSQLLKRGYKGIVFACVNRIAEDVAGTKWHLYRDSVKQNEIVKEDNDEVYNLLSKPNPLMTFSDIIELAQIFLEITGNAYFWLAKDKMGNIREIWLIPSHLIKPIAKINEIGIDYYQASGLIGIKRFEVDEIVHIRYQNPLNFYEGIGTLEKALLEYDIHNYSKQYVMNFYKNGGIPQGILSTNEKISAKDAERIEQIWKQKYQGVSQSWQVAVLWGGFKYEQLSINPATEKFIEQAKWSRDDICAIFRVPPSKLGYVEDVNRANAEANNYTYMQNCVSPKLLKIERVINNILLPRLGVNYTFEFDNVVPENKEQKLEEQKVNIQKANIGAVTGALTIDEVRQLLGFEPIGAETGSKMVDIKEDLEEINRLSKMLGINLDV